MARWGQLAILMLLLVVGVVLSPLRAGAATIPVLCAYDAAVPRTTTTTFGRPEAVRPEAEHARLIPYDEPRVGYDNPSGLRLADGSGTVCAYDGALEHADRRGAGAVSAYVRTPGHADRREVAGDMAIYETSGATTAAEAIPEVAAQSTADIPATMIGQESGPSIVVPQGATGPTPAWNGKGVVYTGGAGGPGLDARVTGVRIMDPTLPKGPSPGYPSGYGSYLNATGQVVDATTGRTLMPTDPGWHIPLQ